MLKRIRSGLTYANVMSTIAVFLILGGATAFAASQLGKNSVGSKQIKKNAVTTVKIKDNAINGAKVADGSLTGSDVADASVPGAKITDGSLSGAKLTDGSVNGAKIADGSLTGTDVKDGSLSGADLADSSVGLAKLAPNSVNSSKVIDSSLTGSDVAAGTFLGGKVTTQFFQAEADLADGASASYNVFCPAGQIALGGGARGDATDSEATNVGSSRPAISSGNTEPPGNNQSFTGWRITVLNPAGGVTTGIRPEVWVICAALP